MAALFTVSLPFDTVAAIQRGDVGLEQLMQNLSFARDTSSRVIHNVASNLIREVQASPFVVTPKAFGVPPMAPCPQVKSHFGGDVTPGAASKSAHFPEGNPPATPVFENGTTDPFSFWNRQSAECTPPSILAHDEHSREYSRMTLIFENEAGVQVEFSVLERITFNRVARIYAARVGKEQSAILFRYRDGVHAGLTLDAFGDQTLHSLGITDGMILLAEDRPVLLTSPVVDQDEITIVFRDLMLKEEEYTFLSTNTFREAVEHYTDYSEPNANKLIFTIQDFTGWGPSYDLRSDHEETLENLGFRNGQVITVKPKPVETSYSITFTIQDAMMKEHSITLKNSSTVFDLDAKYKEIAGCGRANLRFEFKGNAFGCYGLECEETTIEELDIHGGAIVTARPYVQNDYQKRWVRQTVKTQKGRPSSPGGWGSPPARSVSDFGPDGGWGQ